MSNTDLYNTVHRARTMTHHDVQREVGAVVLVGAGIRRQTPQHTLQLDGANRTGGPGRQIEGDKKD